MGENVVVHFLRRSKTLEPPWLIGSHGHEPVGSSWNLSKWHQRKRIASKKNLISMWSVHGLVGDSPNFRSAGWHLRHKSKVIRTILCNQILIKFKFKQNVFRNNDLNALNNCNSTVGRWSVGLGRPNSAPCQRIHHLKHSVLLCHRTRISCTKKIRLCTTYITIKYQRIIKHANLLQWLSAKYDSSTNHH